MAGKGKEKVGIHYRRRCGVNGLTMAEKGFRGLGLIITGKNADSSSHWIVSPGSQAHCKALGRSVD